MFLIHTNKQTHHTIERQRRRHIQYKDEHEDEDADDGKDEDKDINKDQHDESYKVKDKDNDLFLLHPGGLPGFSPTPAIFPKPLPVSSLGSVPASGGESLRDALVESNSMRTSLVATSRFQTIVLTLVDYPVTRRRVGGHLQ